MYFLIFAHVLDPLICLSLRVNDQRPSSAIENEDTIIS